MLTTKNVVIYGVADSLGGAVARAMAKAGANMFLTGHELADVQKVADEIVAAGGKAVAASVNALDEQAVENHLEGMEQMAGSIDVSFNLIGMQDVQNTALADMKLSDFMSPLVTGPKTQFITTTAAARYMKKQGSGVILSLTATPGGIGYPLVGGFGPACCAIEGYSRDLAIELGPFGIRVVNIRSAGSPDSRPFREAMTADAAATNKFLKDWRMIRCSKLYLQWII